MRDVVFGQVILFLIAVTVSIHIITIRDKDNTTKFNNEKE
jgi:hypothetical protein